MMATDCCFMPFKLLIEADVLRSLPMKHSLSRAAISFALMAFTLCAQFGLGVVCLMGGGNPFVISPAVSGLVGIWEAGVRRWAAGETSLKLQVGVHCEVMKVVGSKCWCRG